MAAKRIAAIDMGGTNLKACLFEDGVPALTKEISSEAYKGAAHFLERGAFLLSQLGSFDALGVSTAGQVDPEKGTIRYANDNVPGYTGTDVKSFYEGRFSRPAVVLNDVSAAALGEGFGGAAQGEGDYLCLTYGTGIGGGVVLGGKLYYGAGPSAGAMLGGIVTHPEAVVAGDSFSGTYERFASATALVERGKAVDSSLNSGRAIFARLEEPKVKAVVDSWLDEVCTGLCTLIHAYNVPCVVLGGGVMEQPYAINGAVSRVNERIIPGFRGVRLVGAKLGNMAGLYGVFSLADKL